MMINQHQKYAENFSQLIHDQREIMRIAVCGRFKSGKTSLINLMLGLDLPVKVSTATGTVTKIKYGVRDSVQLADGTYRDVSREELNDYIAIKEKTLDGIKLGEAVTAFTGSTSNLLQKGNVEFWDTPGLEDDYRLTEITLDAVAQCDAVIFVLDATKFLSHQDKMLLSGKLQERVGDNIIVAINRFDLLTNEHDKQEIYQGAEELRKYSPVFTCAELSHQDIKNLMRRVTRLCSSESQRRNCINSARNAKIYARAQEWRGILREDYEQAKQEKNRVRHEIEQFIADQQKKLEDSYKAQKSRLTDNIQNASLALDSTEKWTEILSKMRSVERWEYKYVSLSQEAMDSGLRDMLWSIRYAAERSIDTYEYPECLPLPEISRSGVWDYMNWGSNCTVDNTDGMLAGAIAGAAAGSVIPGIGTIFGAIGGFIAGAMRDGSKDEQEKAAFQKQCVPNTIRAFHNGPAGVAKQAIKHFQGIILGRLEISFNDKIKNIVVPERMKKAYEEFCRQERQLEAYLGMVHSYI